MNNRKQLILLALPAAILAGCASRSEPLEPLEWPEVASLPTPPRRQAASDPDLSGTVEMADLLRLALARNPRIHRARERALAAVQVSAIEGWLPDPRLMLGWYETPVETRVGPQRWSLGVQQAIPWPGKLSAKSSLGRTLARRESVAYERTVRDVLVEVVQTAHELAYIDAAIEISGSIGSLLERYVAAAAGEDSPSPLSELFRAETQRAQLENDRVLLEELRAAEAEHMRALLDLPMDLSVGRPALGVVPPVQTSFEELLAIARSHSQELEEAGLEMEAAALRTSLARRRQWPDITLGYTRIFTDGVDTSVAPAPPDDGKDAEIWHLGLTLPLWVNKNSARVRQAEALERAAALGRREALTSLRQRLARVWFRVGNAERIEKLYAEILVPRAERAARTSEDLRSTGKGTLAGTLETIAVLQNFRLAAARARADYGQAVAELEGLLGRPLAVRGGEVR